MTLLDANVKGQRGVERRQPRGLIMSAACVFPILYLAFVVNYGRNILQLDDWSMAPYLSHFSWGALWGQYREPRIVVNHVLFLADAHLGTFDLRRILIFTAALWCLSYVGVLVMFQRYLGRQLSILAVLAIGAVWFSLADVQNALMAFQTGWFFVVFGLVGMMLALLIPRDHPYLWLGVGAVSAFVGTMGWLQGFVLWPLGLLCILWSSRFKARHYAALWVGAFVVVAIVYFIGYDPHDLSCQPALGCVPESPFAHPVQAARFLLVMLGNLVPGSYTSSDPAHFVNYASQSLVRFEILGFLMLGSAVWVIVGSIRGRASIDRLPVPLVFVLFGLLVDLTVTWGRVGWISTGPIVGNRYVMANLVLLAGVVMYTWAHARSTTLGKIWVGILACFLVFQFAWSTGFGISSARATDAFLHASARVATNVDRYPRSAQACELTLYWIPFSDLAAARASHLAEFSQIGTYVREGAPPIRLPC